MRLYLERVQLIVAEVGSLCSLPQFDHTGLPELCVGGIYRRKDFFLKIMKSPQFRGRFDSLVTSRCTSMFRGRRKFEDKQSKLMLHEDTVSSHK